MTCVVCGCEFTSTRKRDTDRKYCSRKCSTSVTSAAQRTVKPACLRCGERCKVAGRTFCSHQCYAEESRSSGWAAEKEKIAKTCQSCGAAFDVQPCDRDRKFCSRDCNGAHQRTLVAGARPHYGGPDVKLQCEWCATSFAVRPDRARRGKARFCSKVCRSVWVSKYACNSVSKAETAFCSYLRSAGFVFDTQVPFGIYVLDALFRDERVAVEFDGDYWHDLPRVKAKDKRKDKALREAGYTVLRVRQTEYERDPAAFVERLGQLMYYATMEAA